MKFLFLPLFYWLVTLGGTALSAEQPLIYLIMAASSMGKTTQGEKLAATLKVPFYEPDDYHSEANKKKISAGLELTDDDRGPWLDRLKTEILDKNIAAGKRAVMACSALKKKYRERLGLPNPKIQLIYLKGSLQMALANNRKRKGHFAPEATVYHNFKVLEEPTPEEKAIVVDVSDDIDVTFNRMVKALDLP